MDNSPFVVAFQWVIAHGYPLMFAAMFIEGPIITAAASFAAAFGFFNIFIVFILSLLGDLVADIFYYYLGYFGRIKIIARWGHLIGLTKSRLLHIEDLLKRHSVKTIIALKLTPMLPTPGFMIVGASRFSIRKFALVILLVTLPKTIVFVVAGYFFGQALSANPTLLQRLDVVVIIAIALIFVIPLTYTAITERLASKIEKI